MDAGDKVRPCLAFGLCRIERILELKSVPAWKQTQPVELDPGSLSAKLLEFYERLVKHAPAFVFTWRNRGSASINFAMKGMSLANAKWAWEEFLLEEVRAGAL